MICFDAVKQTARSQLQDLQEQTGMSLNETLTAAGGVMALHSLAWHGCMLYCCVA